VREASHFHEIAFRHCTLGFHDRPPKMITEIIIPVVALMKSPRLASSFAPWFSFSFRKNLTTSAVMAVSMFIIALVAFIHPGKPVNSCVFVALCHFLFCFFEI
jgi:hypothetical protein